MNMNLSFSVLTANIISILLIGTLYLANRQKAEYDRDMRLLQQMMVTIGIASISDCCVYYLAGSSNIVIKVLVFLSGSGLFLGNVMIGYLWAKFIMVHMNIPFSDKFLFAFPFILKMGNSDWNCPLIALIMRFFLACTDFCIN